MRRIAVLLSLLFAACGSAEEPTSKPAPKATSDEQQVRTVANQVNDSTDAARICGKLVTAHFLQTYYGGEQAKCVKSQSVSDGKQTIGAVTVKGDSADVATSGPVTGTIQFKREAAQWKLDDYGTDALRSIFVTAIKRADSGALAVPQMKNCMTAQVKQLDDQAVRTFVQGAARKDAGMKQATLEIAGRCPDPLAIYVTDAIVGGMDDVKPKFKACIRKQLTTLLAVTGTAKNALEGATSKKGTDTLKALTEAAVTACAKYY